MGRKGDVHAHELYQTWAPALLVLTDLFHLLLNGRCRCDERSELFQGFLEIRNILDGEEDEVLVALRESKTERKENLNTENGAEGSLVLHNVA